jgi:hypothetical protein
LDAACARGEFSTDILAEHKRRLSAYVSFQFDRTLPSGGVVATYARPTREGGYVVTSTDVTVSRQAAADLTVAKQAAEDAKAQAREILLEERGRQAEARTLSNLDEWLQSCKSRDELFQIAAKFMGYLLSDCFANSTCIPIQAMFWMGPVNGVKTG